uniref:Cytochrome c-type biogenesis protein CcmI n=1 Tax=uncultured bacterium UPO46 TaxID=1776971 RepID=A0A126SY46_9BACT|nr:cytochrome c-type biogenesis protein CcmI [uncultured bacterium UPO46]
MMAFLLAAAALTLAALLLLLRPWRRDRGIHAEAGRAIDDDRRPAIRNDEESVSCSTALLRSCSNSTDFADGAADALNVAVHRDRLAELDRDRASGLIAETDYLEAREEVQRQLLAEISPSATGAAPITTVAHSARAWHGRFWLALLLPLLAAGLYVLLGTPAALLSNAERTANAEREMNDMIAQLEQKMASNPDDVQGWLLLARAYKTMSRWDDAERAYEKIGQPLQANAEWLAELADVLVQKTNSFAGRPHALIARALAVEPDNAKALLLAGAEAFGEKRFAAAIGHWERLLARMEPESDEAKMIAAGVARARELGGMKVGGGETAAQETAAKRGAVAQASPVDAAAGAVSGRVELSPALRAQTTPDQTVFVFARAVNGPRMPLAVLRVRVADLPLDFTLDDSLAMSPQNKLSSAGELRVEARVSKSGQALPAKGDLSGNSAIVKPGNHNVRVLIDRVVE